MSNLSADRLRGALFGLATRRAAIDYAIAVGLILFILLMVAWTIDLAQHLPSIQNKAQSEGRPLAPLALKYLGLRSVDMVARLLPMACFFGAFLAEIRRRLTLEAVILFASGATPLRLFAALFWVGLALGALQTALEARWRPAAIWVQVDLGLGAYAHRFGPRWVDDNHWFLMDDMAIRGSFRRAADPHFRNAYIFEGLSAEVLSRVYSAKTVTPVNGGAGWRLSGVTVWNAEDASGQPSEDIILDLDLVPEMLQYSGVQEFNLPAPALRALSQMPSGPPYPGVRLAEWRRLTAWLLPVSLLVLGVTLARSGFDGRRANVPQLIGLAAIGYVLVVSIKVFWQLGELGSLAAPLAASGGALLALGAASLARGARRV